MASSQHKMNVEENVESSISEIGNNFHNISWANNCLHHVLDFQGEKYFMSKFICKLEAVTSKKNNVGARKIDFGAGKFLAAA